MIGELIVAGVIGLYAMRNAPADVGHAIRGEPSEAEKRAAARDEVKQEKLRQRRDRINLAQQKWEHKKQQEQERKERKESRRQARQRRKQDMEDGNGPGPLFTWAWTMVRDGAVDAHRAHVRNRAARQGKQELRDKGVLGPTGFQKFRANLHGAVDSGWERTNRRLFGEPTPASTPGPVLTLNPVLLLPPAREQRRPELTLNPVLPLPPPTAPADHGGSSVDAGSTDEPHTLPAGDTPSPAGDVLEGEVVIDGEPVTVPDEQPALDPPDPQVVQLPASRVEDDITAFLHGGQQETAPPAPPPFTAPPDEPTGRSAGGPVVHPPHGPGGGHGRLGSNEPGSAGGSGAAVADLSIDTRHNSESKEEQEMAKTGGSLVKANKGFSGKMAKPSGAGSVAKMPEVQDFRDSVAFAAQLGEVVQRSKRVAVSFIHSLKKNDAGKGKISKRVYRITEKLGELERDVVGLQSELRELVALQEQYEADSNKPGKGFFTQKKTRS